jgi:hypothetical protein
MGAVGACGVKAVFYGERKLKAAGATADDSDSESG